MKHLHVRQQDLPLPIIIDDGKHAIVMSLEPAGKDRKGRPKLGARLGDAKDYMKRWFVERFHANRD